MAFSSSAGGALRETIVFVNPRAGGGRAERRWQKLVMAEPRLRQTRVILATEAKEGIAQLDRALAEGARRVIAVGGDGTAHLVAGRVLSAGLGTQVDFGLVPAGTGSDFAGCLGLPKDPLAALRHTLEATPRTIDALRLHTQSGVCRYVVNIASAGLSGAVDTMANAIPDRGRLVYLRATLAALASYHPAPCRVEVDGELFYEGGFFVLAVANGRTFGRGMPIAPEARLDDGLADVVLIPPVPSWQLPWRLPQFLAGRHVCSAFARSCRARRVRLEPLAPMPPFDLDGETLPAEAAEIELLPAALRVLA